MSSRRVIWFRKDVFSDPRVRQCRVTAELLYLRALMRSWQTPVRVCCDQLLTLHVDHPEFPGGQLIHLGLFLPLNTDEFLGFLVPHWRDHCSYTKPLVGRYVAFPLEHLDDPRTPDLSTGAADLYLRTWILCKNGYVRKDQLPDICHPDMRS